MWGTQESLSSTVVPSKRDLLTHAMASVPMWIGATGPIVPVLQICLAFLRMLGKAIHQSYISSKALSNDHFICRKFNAVDRSVVSE